MRLTCVTVELDEALPVFLVHSSSGDRVAELFADLVGVAVLLVDGGLLAGVARDERRISVEPRLAFLKIHCLVIALYGCNLNICLQGSYF